MKTVKMGIACGLGIGVVSKGCQTDYDQQQDEVMELPSDHNGTTYCRVVHFIGRQVT